MIENNFFKLNLGAKTFKIPFIFDGLFHINHQIVNSLILNHQYDVKTSISDDIFKKFIDYWVNGQIPNIQHKNIEEYSKLNREFQLAELNDIIQMKKEFDDKYIDLSKIQTATAVNKLKIIEIISKNLDDYLKHYQIDFMNLPNEILLQIFTHSGRNFTLHDFCYEMICLYYKKTKKIQIFSLLPILDADKLSEDNYKECILKIKQRNNYFPKQNISELIEKNKKCHEIFDILFQCKEIFDKKTEKEKIFLLNACKNEDIDLINLLLGKSFYIPKYEIYGKINQKNKEAGISTFSKKKINNLKIPHSIKLDSEEFKITRILQESFCGSEIKTLQFDENSELKIIDDYAFLDSSIEEIFIPSKLNQIGKFAFKNCQQLKKLHIDENSELKSIDANAFDNTSITSIFIPSGFTEFKDNWCNSACRIEKVIISQKNKRFVFDEKSKMLLGKVNENDVDFNVILFASRKIKEAVIPSNIKIISPSAFDHCQQLKKVTFSEKSELSIIGDSAFSETQIKDILIPASVYKIDSDDFGYCHFLNKFEIDKNSKQIKICNGAFVDSFVENIFIPSDFIYLGSEWCLQTPYLRNISISLHNKQFIYDAENKFLLKKSDLNYDNYDVILFTPRDTKKVVIPSYVKKIAPCAFQCCEFLRSIEFENNSKLELIDDFVFYGTAIEKIIIPPQVKKIGNLSFAVCENLKSVSFSDDSKLEVIDENVFDCSSIESFYIPSSVKMIGSYAFSCNDQLKIVEIGENSKLKTIDETVFSNPFPVFMVPAKMKITINIKINKKF